MPTLSEQLQGLLYTPHQGPAETKRLRALYAGNPAMQQQLVVDDRYHQGVLAAQDGIVPALGTLVGAVPYDLAKLAYFNGPAPVKNALGNLSARMFPGEGFNDKTTSHPDLNQYRGLLSGMLRQWRTP